METILDSQAISEYFSQKKVTSYLKDLGNWLDQNKLQGLLGPADHFAIKVPNEKTLWKIVTAIKPYCLDQSGVTPGLSVRKMDNRLIATALLKNPLHTSFNQIRCIEIMQSKPENVGKDAVGLDHLEFINNDFEGVQKELTAKGIAYGINIKNGYKKTIIITLNDKKEEVKFTDKTLAEVVPIQIKDQPNLVEVILPS